MRIYPWAKVFCFVLFYLSKIQGENEKHLLSCPGCFVLEPLNPHKPPSPWPSLMVSLVEALVTIQKGKQVFVDSTLKSGYIFLV